MRDFASLRPKMGRAVAWLFESVRRLRADVAHIRAWMEKNGLMEEDVEPWAMIRSTSTLLFHAPCCAAPAR